MNKATPGLQKSRFFNILVKQSCKMKIEQITDKSLTPQADGGLHFFHRFIDRSGFSKALI